MSRLANVLIASTVARRLNRLVELLTDNDYAALACETLDETLAEARKGQADLAVVDLSSPGINGLGLAHELHTDPRTADIPVVLVAEQASADLYQKSLMTGADDLFVEPLDDREFLARLLPLRRLATMHAELRRRLALAHRFGVVLDERLDLEAASDRYNVLVLGADPADQRLVADVLEAHGTVTGATVPYEAETRLGEAFFDGAVFVIRDENDRDPMLGLCAGMRNNPRLFNLPVVVLAPPSALLDPREPYRRGATRLLPYPADRAPLRHALLTLVRRQSRRWKIRQALDTTRRGAAVDSLSRTYSFAFLEAHVAGLVDAARQWQKHMTLAFFSVPSVPGIRRQFGDEAADHLLQQLGQWIGSLIRAEDMVARRSETEFCVALPDTPLSEAQVVLHRIAGVLSYTDFALHEVYQPVTVWVDVGMAELQPGDTVESLIARAREGLE